MYYEDTVKYADMVAGMHKFEDTVEHSIVRSDYNHVNLQTKMHRSLCSTTSHDFDVMRLIAESVGPGST